MWLNRVTYKGECGILTFYNQVTCGRWHLSHWRRQYLKNTCTELSINSNKPCNLIFNISICLRIELSTVKFVLRELYCKAGGGGGEWGSSGFKGRSGRGQGGKRTARGLIQSLVNGISQKFILSCLIKHTIFHGLGELCHYLVRNTKEQMCHYVPWKCSQESSYKMKWNKSVHS